MPEMIPILLCVVSASISLPYPTSGVENIIQLNGRINKEEILKILERVKQSLIFLFLPHFQGQDSVKYGGMKQR